MKLLSSLLPYLLLVSFHAGTMAQFDQQKAAALSGSPYDGYSVMLVDGYDTSAVDEVALYSRAKTISKMSDKHLWPMVFLNRFIGNDGAEWAFMPQAGQPYFKAIKGMDIYNERGALSDFKRLWRTALRAAKDNGSPGIVIDPEAYNNYRSYKMDYLSAQAGRTEAEIKQRLHALGAELADIAATEHPQAVLWFLFTGLEAPVGQSEKTELSTVSHIVLGMLEQAQRAEMEITIISGGEASIGYCHENVDAMAERIAQRAERTAWALDRYPHLKLAGTLALWDDPNSRKAAYAKNKCGLSTFKSIAEFVPPMRVLGQSYKYVWIYAPMALDYNPFDMDSAKRFNGPIAEGFGRANKIDDCH